MIIGAGPAGLTAAYELLRRGGDYAVTVLEESDAVGGLSRTVNYRGNRMDIGGHRFFSRVPEVNAWWEAMLPLQGALPLDDRVLGRSASLKPGGSDPEKTDRVMLVRKRLSRIWFQRKFFDYPLSMKAETVRDLGFGLAAAAGFSYLAAILHKRKERSLEDFYINRFGRKLYSLFFESYTAKLWGRSAAEISPDWGAQRVRGLSIRTLLKDVLAKCLHRQNREVETSLIGEFHYPKLGPGQLWEMTADEIERMGGRILKNTSVTGLCREGSQIRCLVCERDGRQERMEADVFISSMPLRDLVMGMDSAPDEIRDIAANLPYRDYITVGVLTTGLLLQNRTGIPTLGGVVPDNWIYVNDPSVHVGRFQIYNNWSPYLVSDPVRSVWLGLEYFCTEGDALWTMPDEAFGKMAVMEMVKIGLIEREDDVLDFHIERARKAYPAYFGSYSRMGGLRDWLDKIENLYCVGRNGQHHYNNMDHWIVSPAIALLFLSVLIRKRKEWKKLIGQFVCFGLVCAPLGMWWEIRNALAFGVPLSYIPRLSETESQFICGISAAKRLFDFSGGQFSYVYDAFIHHGAPYNEYNPTVGLFKTALFDEGIYTAPPFLSATGTVLFWVGTALGLLCFAAFVLMLVRRDSGLDVMTRAFFSVFALTLLISYYAFCFAYPFVCTMNARYCIPLIPLCALGLGLLLRRCAGGGAGEKLLRYLSGGLTALFALISCLMYSMIG